jgi:hypothetical protein
MLLIIIVTALIITVLWLHTMSYDDQIMISNFEIIVCEDASMCIRCVQAYVLLFYHFTIHFTPTEIKGH